MSLTKKHMKYGFYTELEELREDEPEEEFDFGFMENESYINQDPNKNFKYVSAYDFLHGYCFEFALALNEMFGYEIECIMGEENELIHAYCILKENGHNIYIDVRGYTDEYDTFIEEFEDWIEYIETPIYPINNTNQLKDCKNLNASEKYVYAYDIAKRIINENKEYYH